MNEITAAAEDSGKALAIVLTIIVVAFVVFLYRKRSNIKSAISGGGWRAGDAPKRRN